MYNSRLLKARMMERYGGQWKFAAAMGEHEAHVSRVVLGKKTLNPEEQNRWAKALGVDDPKKLFAVESNDSAA